MNNLRRRVENSSGVVLDPVTGRGIVDGYEVVDLGLPSGLLWATCNVGYGVTKETDYGDYYMYGKGSQTYNKSDSVYRGTESPLASSVDTATQVMGEGWRMPTQTEFQDLINNTDYKWVTNFNGSGKKGGKFTSKTNPNAYVFFPAAGCYNDNGSLRNKASNGYVWSSTPYDKNNVYYLDFLSGNMYIRNIVRWYGLSVRGVHAAITLPDSNFIDLGLPSGLKWAKGNLKKSGDTCVIGEEGEYGDFWSWANVGLTNATGWMDAAGGKMTSAMYYTTSGASQSANISGTDASHDVAYKYLGTPWRLPSRTEFEELIDNTDQEWTAINGIYGKKFKKKTDPSIYVFFPASGICYDSGLDSRGSYGGYWSSMCYYDSYEEYSYPYYLNFNSYLANTDYSEPYYGLPVRPVQ